MKSRSSHLLLLPFFLFFGVFWVIPLLGGLRMSLFSNEIYGPTTFVGWEHYRELAQDARYGKALRNTALYTLGSLGLILPLSLVLAQTVRMTFARLRPVLTFLLLLPGLTPPAVLALLFLLVFQNALWCR